jgi:hypothetical protein
MLVCGPAEHDMGDTSVSSSTSAFLGKQVANLNQAKAATSSTFANILHQTQVAVGLRSKTGFSAGATYDNQTIAGQTKAVFNNAISATKSTLGIKP